MGIGSSKKKAEVLDHHDLPTEPLPLIIPTLLTDTVPGQAHPFDYVSIPAPSNFVPMLPTNIPGYPVVSSLIDSTVYQDGTSSTGEKNEPTQRTIWQVGNIIPLWLIPFGVGMCFVTIQILLLLRFAFKLCNPTTAISGVRLVYALSDIVLLPLLALLPPLTQAIFTRVEPYTILAIVLYGFFSRLIVHLLKVLLKVRATSI
jgi:hypothetical protein